MSIVVDTQAHVFLDEIPRLLLQPCFDPAVRELDRGWAQLSTLLVTVLADYGFKLGPKLPASEQGSFCLQLDLSGRLQQLVSL